MRKLGYSLITEEHPPERLLKHARQAEECGFNHLTVSDHFHPWLSTQGESPFVWNILGALSVVTEKIEISTAVTCPTRRYHPAIVAQAAATSARMLEGRFQFGVGSGEALNESIVGQHWPDADTRLAMLEEAVTMIRQLWKGESTTIHGKFYTVENATIFTLPKTLPPITVAASGEKAATLAGRIGDGFWGLAPESELLEVFEKAGGKGKPKYGQLHVCVAKSEQEARRIAHKHWANTGLQGELMAILPTPAHFEQACQIVTPELVAEKVMCGSDAQKHLDKLEEYFKAGYTHVSVHQIGPDHSRFFELYDSEVLPALLGSDTSSATATSKANGATARAR
jgi:coenzyme F420-dependent glucose-6-phosphate dehydrogenase